MARYNFLNSYKFNLNITLQEYEDEMDLLATLIATTREQLSVLNLEITSLYQDRANRSLFYPSFNECMEKKCNKYVQFNLMLNDYVSVYNFNVRLGLILQKNIIKNNRFNVLSLDSGELSFDFPDIIAEKKHQDSVYERSLQNYKSVINNKYFKKEIIPAERSSLQEGALHLILDIFKIFRKTDNIKYYAFSLTSWPMQFFNANVNDFIYQYILPNFSKYWKQVVDSGFDLDKLTELIPCQMDNPHGSCEGIKEEQKENVVLTTHAEESVAEPVTITGDIWEGLCSPQKYEEFTSLMSRWKKFATEKWTKDQPQNTLINSWELPINFIEANLDSVNCTLFKQFAYFRSDLEIRLQINSNKFNCGQLQLSFYYGSDSDLNTKNRENIWCASQMTHSIIDAAGSNDAVLKIPYRYYKPLMGTFKRDDDSSTLNMGKLRLFVLNQLRVPVSDTNPVLLTLYMRFVNPSFHGMKPSDIGNIWAQNEMFGVGDMKNVVNGAAKLINQVFPDDQRDNPSDIIPPKPMVPWSAHSWCIGDLSPEPINPLRLQATGNTPHPPGTIPDQPEQRLDYIYSTFGLVSTVNWTKDQASGTILARIPFSPRLAFDEYPKVHVKNGSKNEYKTCAILPPVAVIAELFGYWRGGLDYRFDFIATQFHTGRIIVGFIPRISSKNINPTVDQLTNCDHVVLDLRDMKQFQYTCSFLSDKPWWPRRSHAAVSTEMYAPGIIYIMVMNQLSVTASIGQSVQFNIYVRGGKDFELHIPVSPRVGLSFNVDEFVGTGNAITYLDAYGPPSTTMYAGAWHSAGNGARIMLRYGPTSDHVTQFNHSNTSGSPISFGSKLAYVLVNDVNITHPNVKDPLRFLVPFIVNADTTYYYGAVFDTLANAQRFADSWNPETKKFNENIMLPTGGKDDGPYVTSSNRIFWTVASAVQANINEERSNVCGDVVEVQKSVKSTWNGLLTFGEQITNIKQLTRRYQPYGRYISTQKGDSNPSLADFCFPVMPQGLDLDPVMSINNKLVENPYSNRMRDGVIPILASGYRFYRGSVRFRMIVTGVEEGVFWLQHRPEYKLMTQGVYKPDTRYSNGVYQSNYASFIQLTSMNNVVEFEVPFYLPGQFGLLQRPNLDKIEDAVHYSMGNIVCGFDTMKGRPKDVPYYVQIFYSMGDDMSFSVFQGFPPMLNIEGYEKFKIVAQGPITDFKDKIVTKVKDKVTKSILDEVTVDIKKEILNTSEQPSTSSDNNSSESVQDESITDRLKNVLSNAGVTLDIHKQSAVLFVISNLVHTIINPSIKQIAWSFASVLMHLGIIAFSCVDAFIKGFSGVAAAYNTLALKARNWYNSKFKNPPAEQSNVAGAQGPLSEEDQVESAFISTCVTGMLALVKAKNKPIPKSIPNFAAYLYDGLPKFSLTANGLFKFFENNLNMFKKIWYWLVSKIYPNKVLYTELDGASDDVVTFVKKVQGLLDSRNADKVRKDPSWTLSVYECANIASAFLAKVAVSSKEVRLPLFEGYCHKIVKLRDTLTNEMLCPPVRFEPFVICLEGETNVGKSHLAQTLFKQLFQSIGYKSFEELVYVRTPGVAYWNGLRNQPGCLFDDFLCLEDQNFGLQQIGELFCLKSKAVFNPPMAAIEEKKLRYNPLIIILCANKAYPSISGVGTPNAWWRRRDMMVKVSKKTEYKGKHPRSLAKSVKEIYGHLEFQVYDDPGDDQSRLANKQPYGEVLTTLIKQFHNYFEEECIQFDNALGQVKNFYPDPSETNETNMAALLKTVEEVNDSRVPILDKAEIVDYKKRIKEDLISSDFTWFFKKKVLEEKVKKVKIQEEKEKKKIVQNAGEDQINVVEEVEAELERVDNFDDLSEAGKLLLYNNLVGTEGDSVAVDKFLEFETDDVFQCLINYGKIQHLDVGFKIKRLLLKLMLIYLCKNKRVGSMIDMVCGDVLGKDVVISNEQNLHIAMLFTNLLKVKEELGVSRHSVDKIPCLCWINMTKDATIGEQISKNNVKINRYLPGYSRFDGVVPCSLTFGLCQQEYCLVKLRFDRAYNLCLYNFKDHSSDNKPDIIERGLLDLKSKGKIELITPIDDVLVEINQKWYEKIWSYLPGWGTIIKRLGQGILIFTGLLSLFKLGNMLFSASNDYKSNKRESELLQQSNVIVKELWDDPVYIKKFKDATSDSIAKSIVQSSIREAEGPSYSAGTVASKVKAPIMSKIINNSNASMSDIMINLVKRNTFWFSIETEKKIRRLRCFGLNLNYFIILDHYVFLIQELINSGEAVRIFFIQDTARVELDLGVVLDCIEIVDSTFRIGKMPRCIPAFKNAIKFMISSDSTKNIAPQGYLLEYTLNDDGSYIMSRTEFARINRRRDIIVANDDGSQTLVSSVFEYERSGRGVCGSILCSSSNINTPILGIHVAGKVNGNGFSESTVKETFNSLITKEPKLFESEIINNMRDPNEAIVFLDGNVRAIGCVPKNQVVYPPIKSRLIHSVCYNKLTESTYDVPVLHSKDPRLLNKFSPLLEGCKYHSHVITKMPNDFINLAYMDLEKKILTHCLPQRMEIGVLTIEQAVCGVKDNPKYEAMVMDTSEGFPWILKRPKGFSNKSWMFDRTLTDSGWKLNAVNTELLKDMAFKEQHRKNGYYFPIIFTDCLKDAKLPKEKCLLPGKTRIFSTSPVDYTIQQRQYNFDFVVAYQNSRFETEHAIGIDMMSTECDILVNKLLDNSNNIIAADYSKFGDSLQADCVHNVFKIIIEWYKLNGDDSVENVMVRKCLGLEVQNAYHLMLNYVYQCFGGMPSGNPLTVVINSLVNSMYIRVAWLTIYHKKQLFSLYYFSQYVEMITYGDDLIMSVKDEVINEFNCGTIITALSKYNIKMTGATKDDKIYQFKRINDPEITFLKCTFHRHPRRKLWLARMEKRVVEETCNWVWSTNKDVRASSIEACDAMLQISFGHGRSYYEELRKKIEKFWQQNKVFINLPSWEEVDLRIYEI